jgi:hypothetical protein
MVQCTTHSTNNGTPSIDRSVSLRPFRDPGLLLGPKQRGVDLLRGARGQAVWIGQGWRVEVLLDCFDATARNVLLSR